MHGPWCPDAGLLHARYQRSQSAMTVTLYASYHGKSTTQPLGAVRWCGQGITPPVAPWADRVVYARADATRTRRSHG